MANDHLDTMAVSLNDDVMNIEVEVDAEIARQIRTIADDRQQSFNETINDVLRCGLESVESQQHHDRFVVKPHFGGFKPGIDPARLNQLLDELETADFAEAHKVI